MKTFNSRYKIDLASDNKWWENKVLKIEDIKEDEIGVEIFCSTFNAYNNNIHPLKNLKIEGNSKNRLGTGVLIHFCPFVNFDNLNIKFFDTNLKFGDNVWCNKFNNLSTYASNTAIHYPKQTLNAGENIVFFGSTIFNSKIGVLAEEGGATGLNFIGCSFDYCWDTHLVIKDGCNISLDACHIENYAEHLNKRTAIDIIGKDSCLNINNSIIYFSGKRKEDKNLKPVFYNEGRLSVDNTKIYNAGGKFLIKGKGTSFIGNNIFNQKSSKRVEKWYDRIL